MGFLSRFSIARDLLSPSLFVRLNAIQSLDLFQNNHSSRGSENASLQGVNIQATGHDFTMLVPTIPIGGGFAGQVVSRSLVAEIQFSHEFPADIVDAKGLPGNPTLTDKAAHVSGLNGFG